MVTTAVQELVLEEVDEVHQELVTGGAGEAGGVPHPLVARAGGKHSHGTARDNALALKTHSTVSDTGFF